MTYSFEALKHRLLIEKVIITSESISEYYEKNYDRFFLNSNSKENPANIRASCRNNSDQQSTTT